MIIISFHSDANCAGQGSEIVSASSFIFRGRRCAPAVAPHHRDLVESLFFYDVVGLQTQEWLDPSCIMRSISWAPTSATMACLVYQGRKMRAIACPIGIDAAGFAAMAREGARDHRL